MISAIRTTIALLTLTFALASEGSAEVLIRWDQDRIPSTASLGLTTVAVPAANAALVRDARIQGYRVWLETDNAGLAALKLPREGVAGVIVTGGPSEAELRQFEKRVNAPMLRVVGVEERGKWPHIRTNWVTKNNDVLQVTGRSAQPWIENNAALIRIAGGSRSERPFFLTYPWKPITLADIDEGPALENYLVAIAETGSFGGDLLLPLHATFQRRLLVGDPQTRAEWSEIRRNIEFYSWNLPARYQPLANVGVVTAEPAQSYETFNLLLRHNVPFDLIAPTTLSTKQLDAIDLLLVLDPLESDALTRVSDFAKSGKTVAVVTPAPSDLPWRSESPATKTDRRVGYRFGKGRVVEFLSAVADPNAFALEVRQLLGRDNRLLDIWNGITVLTTSYREPASESVLVTAVNYAHQPLPVQLRVRGTFAVVQYESPEEPLALLPYQHRDGYTEFVLPALRVGGRVFLRK